MSQPREPGIHDAFFRSDFSKPENMAFAQVGPTAITDVLQKAGFEHVRIATERRSTMS